MKAPLASCMIGAVLAFGAAAPPAVLAQRLTMDTPAAPALNKGDQKIIAELARANIAEIEAGKLALARGQSPQIKAYAKQMIDEHTQALNEVKRLAQDKGVNLPTEADARHKALVKMLGKLEGVKFDKAYLTQAGVRDHTKVHAALEQHHARAKDQDLKAFISKMLPTVEQHLHHATQMQEGATAPK